MTIRVKKILITLLTITAVLCFGVLLVRAFFYFPSEEIALTPEAEQELIIPTPPAEDTPDSQLAAATKSAQLAVTKNETKKSAQEAPSTRLIIPAIKVSAKVVNVGVTAKGNMASPSNFSQVGWYKYGPFPGETGSAVLAGHINNGISMPAVFANLGKLKTGDDVYVETKEGKKLHFKVTGRKIYAYDSRPEEVFLDDSGKYLKLITCVGSIIRELRTHSQRLVVTAELVE